MNFSDMIVGEVATLTFDFSETLPAGASIVGTPATNPVVHAGVDPNPAALVTGAPVVDGPVVTIRVSPTVPNVSYWPRVTATYSDGQVVTLPDPGDGSLRVVP